VRYLILSDIHANREALEAVLVHARGKYDRAVCCGDVVGYGADPNWAVDWVRANVTDIVRGNHDRVCAGLVDLDWFNQAARASAEWTHHTLTPENLAWLRELPPGPVTVDGFQLLHGSPLDEDEYLLSPRDAAEVARYVEQNVSFFGHTHMQGGFVLNRNGVKSLPHPSLRLDEEPLEIEPDTVYLINPGSVGQPRDRDPRAAYVIYTPEQRLVEYFRTPYDVEAAQAKIRNAQLPDILAERLSSGA
jgi:predicted phosphodiesterase